MKRYETEINTENTVNSPAVDLFPSPGKALQPHIGVGEGNDEVVAVTQTLVDA